MDFKLLDVFRLEAVTPGKGIVKGVMGVFVQGLIFLCWVRLLWMLRYVKLC